MRSSANIALCLAAATVAGLVALRSVTVAAVAHSHLSPGQQAQDAGPTNPSTIVSAALILNVTDPAGLEALAAAVQDPSSNRYHKFISTEVFANQFAPSEQNIQLITRSLAGFGISVDAVFGDRLLLQVSGPASAFDSFFGSNLHDFVLNGRRFHKPQNAAQIPAELSGLVAAVVGPSTESRFQPRLTRAATSKVIPAAQALQADALATNQPGDYLVGDVANFYNVNPLYAAHIDGSGQTIGIVTLAGFHPEDAYAYWNAVGLHVNQNRITQIHVDGGGVVSADAGSGETSLDVEQSGGLAPAAKLRVFDAPNTDASFIDAFYLAISENRVDTLSTSWGLAELFLNDNVGGPGASADFAVYHQVFLEAGVQGISLFGSAGDNGAYDMNAGFNQCVCGVPLANVLTVDHPSSDPAMTSAGGTTRPVKFMFKGIAQPLLVPHEQVWGWSYLQNFLQPFGIVPPNALFPAGTGGGVSSVWTRPSYQLATTGMRSTEPNQSVVVLGPGGGDLFDVPANFAGRNVPDVSLNADPETGYIIFSTEDGGVVDGFGGTSFVAPQLNGLTALVAQANHGRVGFLNPMLYRFQRQYGYSAQSPLRDITQGDNWFYTGIAGYEPGAGLGVLNAANLVGAVLAEGKNN